MKNKALTEDTGNVLALLERESPDLALVVDAWDGLPEPVRAGIVGMVRAAEASKPDAS